MKCAWGFIVRDHKRAMVITNARRINVLHEALSPETHACLDTLYSTIDNGMSQILLETDSTNLVEALESCSYDFPACSALFREENFLISMNFVQIDTFHVPRSCNWCAHEFYCYSLIFYSDWIPCLNYSPTRVCTNLGGS